MRRFIYILTALSALAACSRNAFNGSVDELVASTESCPVQVSIGTAGKVTRGNGPMEDENIWLWRNEKIHVYGFRHDVQSFETRNSENSEICLMDGSKDGNRNGGKLALASGGEPYVKWDKNEPDWFPKGIKPYYFYAYYLDDYEIEDSQIVREKDRIYFPVEIDGTTDFMTARSHVEGHQLEDRGYSPEEKKVLRNHAYCAYTANNGWQPELFFRHHLVRLTFEVYAGRKQGEKMCVQDLHVETRTRADFIVAHKDTSKIGLDFSKDDAPILMPLLEEDLKSPLRKNYYYPVWKDEFENIDVYSREKIRIGGTMMIAPATRYVCHLKMIEDLNGEPFDWDSTLYLNSAEGSFEAGKHYVIRIALWGSHEVDAKATVYKWDDGGDIVIDPDIEFDGKN